MVSKLIDTMEIDHLLDYGCGEAHTFSETLKPERNFTYQAYDPNVPAYSSEPIPAALVVSVDYLSRLPLCDVDDALDEIEELTEWALFCTINSKQPLEWWLPKFMERFSLQRLQVTGKQSFCIVAYSN